MRAVGWWLAVSISTLIVGALLVLLAPAALLAGERAVRERLGATVGWGVAIAIGAPLLAVLALVTLVGDPFGVALLLARRSSGASFLRGEFPAVLRRRPQRPDPCDR